MKFKIENIVTNGWRYFKKSERQLKETKDTLKIIEPVLNENGQCSQVLEKIGLIVESQLIKFCKLNLVCYSVKQYISEVLYFL